jgi:hypothetical protein
MHHAMLSSRPLLLAEWLQLHCVELQVSVPHFKRSQSSADDASRNRLAQLPRRRTGDSIMAGMQAEADKAWRAPAPVPAGKNHLRMHADWFTYMLHHIWSAAALDQLSSSNGQRHVHGQQCCLPLCTTVC